MISGKELLYCGEKLGDPAESAHKPDAVSQRSFPDCVSSSANSVLLRAITHTLSGNTSEGEANSDEQKWYFVFDKTRR